MAHNNKGEIFVYKNYGLRHRRIIEREKKIHSPLIYCLPNILQFLPVWTITVNEKATEKKGTNVNIASSEYFSFSNLLSFY